MVQLLPKPSIQPLSLSHNNLESSHSEFMVRDTFRFGYRTADDQLTTPEMGQVQALEMHLAAYDQVQRAARHEVKQRLQGKDVRSDLEAQEWRQKQLSQTRLPALAHSLSQSSSSVPYGQCGSDLGMEILNGDDIDFSNTHSFMRSGDEFVDVHGSAEVYRLGWSKAV